MKYGVLVLLLLFIPAASAQMQVENDQMYDGPDGTVHITGEIRNSLDVPLSMVKMEAAMYSKDGEGIGKASAYSPVNSIMPGMSAPFDIVVPAKYEVVGYTLSVQYSAGSERDRSIEISSSEMHVDSLGNLLVSGFLKNNGGNTANMVNVVVTIYDSVGNVAGVASSHIKPDYLRASDSAYFVLAVPDTAEDISHYVVTAESEEYAAAPEFSAGSALLLAGCVAWYLVLGKKMRVLEQPASA